MRTIRVEERESGHTWVWIAAAAVVGLGVGVLVSERTRGRRLSLGKLVARGRGLASKLAGSIGPLMETARELKDAWDGDEDEESSRAALGDEELDEEIDDEELDEDEDDLDEDDDDEDDLEDEDDEEDDSDPPAHAALDARVLEAFSHDPILAARAVEIEETGSGVIVLHGRVRNSREVKHAVTMARGVPGVTRVREKLTVLRAR